MLVRFVDTKEKVVWINPVHVKMLAEKKPEVTSIILNIPATAPVNVRQSIDTVAAMLNAAMPLDPYAAIATEEDGAMGDGGASAAAIAASF